MSRIVLLALVLAACAAPARPRADTLALPSPDTAHSTLSAVSNVPGVRVILDSADLGVLPLERKAIPAGRHLLRFVHPEGESWFRPAVLETLVVDHPEDIRRQVSFLPICRITSDPFGAAVRSRDSLLGTTPVSMEVVPGRESITLARDGYEPLTLRLPDSGGGVYSRLKPLPGRADRAQPLFLTGEDGKDPLPVYVAAGATVLAGVGAAYFKIKADNYYSDYQLTGSPGTLDRVHKLDVFSGISLAASQMSLLLLSYLLLSRE
jgi:hypothetical protein